MMNLRSYHRLGIVITILVMIAMLGSCRSERSGYEGKELWVFGDSITKGVGTTDPDYFPELLGEELGCRVTKKGHSGYAFTQGLGDYGYCVLDIMEEELNDAPGNCDVLLVCFGANDWYWGREVEGDRAIGTVSDETRYTLCGALHLFCQGLDQMFSSYPETEIYFVTPMPIKIPPKSGGDPAEETWDQTKTNGNGETLRDISEAILETAQRYGYGSIDLNQAVNDMELSPEELDLLIPDGLHPNAAGNHLIKDIIKEALE